MRHVIGWLFLAQSVHALVPGMAAAQEDVAPEEGAPARDDLSSPYEGAAPRTEARRPSRTSEYVAAVVSLCIGAGATAYGIGMVIFASLPPLFPFGGGDTDLLAGLAIGTFLTGAVGLTTGAILMAVAPHHRPAEPEVAFDVSILDGGGYVRVGFTL